MNFVEATDRLMADGTTLETVAERLGMSYATIRAARLNPGSSSFRKPPVRWRRGLAELAREKSTRLAGLAEVLEREALELER